MISRTRHNKNMKWTVYEFNDMHVFTCDKV